MRLVAWLLFSFFPPLVILCLFSFFFFQAEDGIRDHCVTGVQTCALPICQLDWLPLAEPLRDLPKWKPVELATAAFGQGVDVTPIEMLAATDVIATGGNRSEERRVGKEGRARWTRGQDNIMRENGEKR